MPSTQLSHTISVRSSKVSSAGTPFSALSLSLSSSRSTIWFPLGVILRGPSNGQGQRSSRQALLTNVPKRSSQHADYRLRLAQSDQLLVPSSIVISRIYRYSHSPMAKRPDFMNKDKRVSRLQSHL